MSRKMGWWHWAAAVLSLAALVVFGGILFDSEDSGSIWVRIGVASVAATGAILVGAGIMKRGRHAGSSLMVAIGLIPAFGLVLFLWFPPLAIAGILAIVIAGVAEATSGEPKWLARPSGAFEDDGSPEESLALVGDLESL